MSAVLSSPAATYTSSSKRRSVRFDSKKEYILDPVRTSHSRSSSGSSSSSLDSSTSYRAPSALHQPVPRRHLNLRSVPADSRASSDAPPLPPLSSLQTTAQIKESLRRPLDRLDDLPTLLVSSVSPP